MARRLTDSLLQRALPGALALVACVGAPSIAHAVSPLEYPDTGTTSFARAGAWLAAADTPVTTHFNPAALAAGGSAVSVDLKLTYPDICFDRTTIDENGQEVPAEIGFGVTGRSAAQYQKVCNQRRSFPISIPAIAVSWRASEKLGVGFAIVPPSAYGNSSLMWAGYEPAIDTTTGEKKLAPSPARFMTLQNQSTILFPTASVGYEVVDNFRVGLGFISGIAVVNASTGAQSSVNAGQPFDRADQDSRSDILVKDLFVPGAVLSVHWSPHPMLDVALWGRWMDSIRATDGDLRVRTRYTADDGTTSKPTCVTDGLGFDCNTTAVPNDFADEAFVRFEFPFPPPEVRAGLRFHMPRSDKKPMMQFGEEVRDPLHDDVFDVELDGSYTWGSHTDELQIRFVPNNVGSGIPIKPSAGFLPPIADRPTGFTDSIGVRLGGQYNAIQDKLGVLAGVWYETQGQDPKLLNIAPPGPARGGVAGGLIIRQNFIDFVFGYQYHWAATIDNGGAGIVRGPAGSTQSGSFSINNEPRETPAVDRTQFRTYHYINGGSVTLKAHAFSLGGVMRF